MSAWIGPLGNLIEFKCPSAVESSSEDPHVYFRPLGGSLSVTQLGDPSRPRVWEVKVDAARPDHVAALEGLGSGEWGVGPFVFIPPAAPTLNLLGKADLMCIGTPSSGYVAGRPGTPVVTTEGVAGAAYLSTTGSSITAAVGRAPVLGSQPVTGKAWVQPAPGETAALALRFYDAAGSTLLTAPAGSTSETAGAFLTCTAIAPEGAAYASLIVTGVLVTRPQITWTDAPREWVPSEASTNVVMSPLSGSVRRATGRPGEETITDHAFTVTELRA